jgi:simple sugar transport system permease protein
MKTEIKSIIDNLISLIIVFLVISIFLILIGSSPFEVYVAFIEGAFGNTDRFSRTLLTTAILSISAFALVVTFTGGLRNIGIEGQLVAGSIGATVIARSFIGETVAAPVFEILLGSIFGSLIAVFCGILKVKARVHEIFGGLGLDFVASGAIVYLVIGPWKRSGIASTSGTDIFAETAWIKGLGEYGLPIWPIIFALIVGVFLMFCFKRTAFGLSLKAVGLKQNIRKTPTIKAKIIGQIGSPYSPNPFIQAVSANISVPLVDAIPLLFQGPITK